MNLYQLTGTELDRAHNAADYLLTLNAKCSVLDRLLAVKLESLRADLKAEQEDRRDIARR